MTGKVIKLPTKTNGSWLVYVPGQREPTFVTADEMEIVEGTAGTNLLEFSRGGVAVMVFNRWDYFERLEDKPAEAST